MPSINELRKKTGVKRYDPVYRVMNYLAYYPAKLFLALPITPNQITLFWMIGQVVASLFLISGDKMTMIVALLVYQTFFVIDCTDGIVARYKKMFSLNGIYLDHIGHYVAGPLLLIGYGIGTARWVGRIEYLGLGLFAALLFLLNKAVTLNPGWYPARDRDKITDSKQSLLRNQHAPMKSFFSLFRLEYYTNIMFWGTLFGYPHYTLLVYAVFYFFELMRKIAAQYAANAVREREIVSKKTTKRKKARKRK